MFYSTTDVYATKRETVQFAKDLVSESGQVETKFITQAIYGILKSKSVILRDIAEALGMHESTISRVTTNKYVHTPQGLFELKYFFNSSIRRVANEDIASESVKQAIKKIIDDEDKKNPLSDQALVKRLESDSGIKIARRTVAKYREMLGILSSSKRKKLF